MNRINNWSRIKLQYAKKIIANYGIKNETNQDDSWMSEIKLKVQLTAESSLSSIIKIPNHDYFPKISMITDNFCINIKQ